MIDLADPAAAQHQCHDEIFSTAWTVRIMAEEQAYRETQEEEHDLNGYCARASAELWRQLSSRNIRAEIRVVENNDGSHVFLAVDDYILDITATQFRRFRDQPVVFMHERELADSRWHANSRSFDTDAELQDYQQRAGWPQNQQARVVAESI